MRLLISALALAVCLGAQTSNYPASIDNDASLYVAGDNVQTTLASAMAPGDAVAIIKSCAPVTSCGFAVAMIATVCDATATVASGVTKCTLWEHMKVTGVSGNQLTVQRGQLGTAAGSHSAGKLISILIDAGHQAALKNAIIAIQSALGPNLSSIPKSPVVSAGQYAFGPITSGAGVSVSGGNLIAGANTLTFANVPPGVNGTDLNHGLYVSAGTGTAETCNILGGSGLAGDVNGQIIVTCAKPHSGSWSIQSSTGGALEAQWALPATGGTVQLPCGSVAIHGPIKRRTGMPVTMQGCGVQSTLLAIAADFPLTANGVFDWSPGDALATSEGGANNLAVKFLQPDSANPALYTHWPPAFYTVGTYHTEWRNVEVTAAWDIATIPGGTNGAQFFNITSSYYNRGISVDGSYDTIRIDNFHTATTGLTANQITAFVTTTNVSFWIGRADDLKISDSTSDTKICLNFHSGVDGNGPIAGVVNLWCDAGPVQQTNGISRFVNLHMAISTATAGVSMTGGQMILVNPWILYTGTAQAVLAQAQANASVGGGGTYPPMFGIEGGRVDTQTVDTQSVATCTTAVAYTGEFNCSLQGITFYRTPGQAYTHRFIDIVAGTGDTRATVSGNRFEGLGGGSGVGILVDTDAYHVLTNNDGGGYSYSLPATTAKLAWLGNSNFSSNLHLSHDPVKISAALTASTVKMLQTDNYIASETGGNNTLVVALTDAAGVNVPLAAGLKVTILLGHTTQAGANTLVLNGGAAKAIKKHSNPATDLSTAYIVGSLVTWIYDGTVWQDLGQ